MRGCGKPGMMEDLKNGAIWCWCGGRTRLKGRIMEVCEIKLPNWRLNGRPLGEIHLKAVLFYTKRWVSQQDRKKEVD